VHIVGLNVDTADHALQQGLARLREFRQWRAVEIGRRLQKKRIEGAYEGARRLAKGTIVSRTHFARFLVEQGYVRGMQQAFKQFLSSGKPGHVPGQWATLDEAVSWIRSAGGQAVVAHPARYKLSAGKLLRLFGEFHECGGEAIEVISGSHPPEATQHFARIAAEQDFLASAGSDYHGPDNFAGSEIGRALARPEGASYRDVARQKAWRGLGRLPALPDGCVPVWRDWEMTGLAAHKAVAGCLS